MIADFHALTDDVVLRPVTSADAAALARAYVRNWEHLAPWEPVRDKEFFTEVGQAALLATQEEERRRGRYARWALADRAGEIVGSVALSSIVLGPFRNADLGYWIDGRLTRRGLTSAAVDVVCGLAADRLGLHRIQAGTCLDNLASQRVLAKCGFEPFGVAPRYLHIAGRWRDHRLFQRILNDRAPGEPATAGS
jgi:[ribosomal protein S5]-alanine N-acetyltransferase